MDEPAQLVDLALEGDTGLGKAIVHDGWTVGGVAAGAEEVNEPAAQEVGGRPPDAWPVFGFEAARACEDERPAPNDLTETIGASLERVTALGLGDDQAETTDVEAVEEVGKAKGPTALRKAQEDPAAVAAEACATKFVVGGLDDLVNVEDGTGEDVEGDTTLAEELAEGFDAGVAGVEGLAEAGLSRRAADKGLGAGSEGEAGKCDGIVRPARTERAEEICKEVDHGRWRLPARGTDRRPCAKLPPARGYSSAGRAPGSHPGGQRFEPA